MCCPPPQKKTVTDYGAPFPKFRDAATYWLKLPIFATPLSFVALAPYVSFGLSQ